MAAAQDEDESPRNAATKVFRIAELAEMILHGVDDAPTLVHARRVNKIFKEVIDRDMRKSKQKYWLACDVPHLRWDEDEFTLLYPEARPDEIELNPWAARGCIPKLSLQYHGAWFDDIRALYGTSLAIVVDADIFEGKHDEWWHGMEILRLKEQKRDLSLVVIIKYSGSSLQPGDLYKLLDAGNTFDMHLPELDEEQYTIKGMIEYAFLLRDVHRSALESLEDI